MFTIEQIKAAHAKVKSGSDFPSYVQDIIKLGVTGYETHVEDGNTVYFGKDNHSVESGPRYKPLVVSPKTDKEQFQKDLKATQEGKTDYPAFCLDAARSGVEKWAIRVADKTCTYYDKNGKTLLVETIPGL
jgi:uncharacterized protein YbcV (DUF1398 family)